MNLVLVENQPDALLIHVGEGHLPGVRGEEVRNGEVRVVGLGW